MKFRDKVLTCALALSLYLTMAPIHGLTAAGGAGNSNAPLSPALTPVQGEPAVDVPALVEPEASAPAEEATPEGESGAPAEAPH